MSQELTTAKAVIEALGGPTAVARMTNRKPQHVVNWRAAGRLPPKTFLVVSQALVERGKTAPSSLWGIDSPPSVPGDEPEVAS